MGKKKKKMNRSFTEEDTKMISKDMKRCSTLLAIREMQNWNHSEISLHTW